VRNMLWRVVYAAIAVVMFWLIFPLFLAVIGFALPANLVLLLRLVTACLAVLYVLFGPVPAAPW